MSWRKPHLKLSHQDLVGGAKLLLGWLHLVEGLLEGLADRKDVLVQLRERVNKLILS